MRSLLRRSAWLLCSLFAIYLVAGNIFLNTAFGPWAINRKPEKFTLDWSYGITWWPGWVALWNVQAKGHVRHIVWSADAALARGRIALLPLVGKELVIPSLQVDKVSADIAKVIEDIPSPEYRPDGWTLRFEHIASDSVYRVGALGALIETRGSAVFAFSKQLRGGPMEIFPSSITLRETRIRFGEQEWLHGASIDAHLSMRRHRTSEVQGLERIALLDASLKVDAVSPGLSVDLDPAGHWRGKVAAVTNGKLGVDLSLHDGRLQSGGSLDVHIPMVATRGAIATNDAASVRVSVGDADIRVHAALPSPPEGSGSATVDLSLAGTSIREHRDLRSMLPALSGSVAVDWHFNSLDWLGPLLVKSPWLSMHGAGRVKADLDLLHGRLQPGSMADIPEVDLIADVAGHRFSGHAKAQARLDAGDKGPVAQIGLHIAEFSAAANDALEKPLLRGENLNLDFASQGDLDNFRDSLRANLRFENAQVPDLRALNTYLPGNSFKVTEGGAGFDGDLTLDAKGTIQRGRIGIHGKRIGARLGEIGLSGDFDLDARIGGSDVAVRHFDLGNTQLRLRNIRVIDAGRTAGENWWANLKLTRGQLEAGRPLRVDAKADIELENIGLLLALFTRHSDYPRWALKLVDAGNVRATGRVVMRDKTLLFDGVEARNDRFEINARLRLANARPKGDLLLRWRALGMGLELDEAKREFHFLRASDWYHARPALLAD